MRAFLSSVSWGVVLTLCVGACGGSQPTALPMAPTSMPLSPPVITRPQLGVAGSVVDVISTPLVGATVEVLDGPTAGMSTVTDALGRFSIDADVDEMVRFRASKTGYLTATKTSFSTCATCPRFVGFVLVQNAPPLDITGNYTITFLAADSCGGIPEEARTRTFNGKVSTDATLKGLFHVELGDPSVLHGYSWEGISLGIVGDNFAMFSGNQHGDPGVVEQIQRDAYMAFDGSASGSLASSANVFSARFDGLVEYCRLPEGSPSPIATGRYQCIVSTPNERVQCMSINHRVVFTRR
jgi:hypothetical protein